LIVVDASVVALWSLPQDHAALASSVLGAGVPLLAPALVRLEVASPLLRAVRRGELTADAARRVLELLPSTLIFADEPADELRAFEIALTHGGSALDACYVALAQRLGARLVTNDQRMHRTAAAAGVASRFLPDGPPW
jgi:predicted nucleic acid-binding protein